MLISGCLGKPKPKKGDFNGKVIDYYTKEPVPGVAVIINGNHEITDNSGKFSIRVLKPGEYNISMARDWYYPTTQSFKHVGRTDLWTFEIKSEPLNGKILYSGDRDKNWEIYELNLMDRHAIRLTYLSNSSETNPVKKDTNTIIFQSDSKGNNDLYSCDFGTIHTLPSSITCCNFNYNDEHPSVDYFGTKLVFKSGVINNGGEQKVIRLYNFKESVDIMEGTQYITGFNPVINSDGTKIALVSGDYKKLLIYDVEDNASGISITFSKKFDFFTNQQFKINNPCWHPEFNLIALEAYQDSEGVRLIYLVNADSDTTPTLQPITYNKRFNEQHHHPCWSSKGGLLFFSGNIVYSSREDIYCIKYDNSDGIFETVKNNTSWLMVSSGSGDKKYPSWSE